MRVGFVLTSSLKFVLTLLFSLYWKFVQSGCFFIFVLGASKYHYLEDITCEKKMYLEEKCNSERVASFLLE